MHHTETKPTRWAALTVAGVLLLPAVAMAKPWQGVQAGVTRRAEVVKKFGEPSRVVTKDGKETLAYFQKQAIRGTSQAQFRVDSKTGVVERIDVFPGPVVDRDTVEATYGAQCGTPAAAKDPTLPCYVKKLTDDFRTYFMYASVGIAVFFNEDTKTVHSFIFQPVKKAGTSSASGSRETAEPSNAN